MQNMEINAGVAGLPDEQTFPDKHRPIYVYCQSGARSARSAKLLELLGYENVTDLGGISGYTGPRA